MTIQQNYIVLIGIAWVGKTIIESGVGSGRRVFFEFFGGKRRKKKVKTIERDS